MSLIQSSWVGLGFSAALSEGSARYSTPRSME